MVKNYEKAYKDYKKGMSYKDIASKYNTTMNTVKSWKRRQWKAMEEAEDAERVRKEEEKAHKRTQRKYTEEARQAMRERGKRLSSSGANRAKEDSENIKQLREMVTYKKAHAPASYEVKDIGKMIQRLSNYFIICDENGKPYTRAGIVLALDISKPTFDRYKNGELDYLLEEHILVNHIDTDTCERITAEDGSELVIDEWGNPLIGFSSVIQKALLRLEDQAESRLYAKGRPGDIFTMKQYGWTDEKSPSNVHNTLVIASAEEADRALKMLYGGD